MTVHFDDGQFPPRLLEAMDPADLALRDLLRAAQTVGVTSDLKRQDIERRLREDRHVRAQVPARRLQPAAVLLVVAVGFGTAVGAAAYRRLLPAAVRPVHKQSGGGEERLHRTQQTPAKTVPDEPQKDLVARAITTLPESRSANTPGRVASRTLKRMAVKVDDKVAEHEMISQGLRALRLKHNPDAALESLDAYDKAFPSGTLAPEAQSLRVEALVSLGRKREAVLVLNQLLLQPLPGADSRRVLRAELNVSMGEFKAALQDFDRTLVSTATLDSSVVERALWGRAVAHAYLGNEAAANMDLSRYLSRFPLGRFAALARSRQEK